ncbi:polyprenyl synthetase family protein [Streptomyces sp. NPDC055051]
MRGDVREGRDLLAWGLDTVRPTLEKIVAELPGEVAPLARYCNGFQHADGTPIDPPRTGKWLRPTLVLLAAGAAGGDPEEVLRIAAATELMQASSLLHDDIADDDRARHGLPAAWVAFGTGPALFLGNILAAKALEVVAEESGTAPALLPLAIRALVELNVGQTRDCLLERREPGDVSLREYEELCTGKTDNLVRFALVCGATLGGASDQAIDALRRAGLHAALAGQAGNDMGNVWNDGIATGKTPLTDLLTGKHTLPVILGLRTAPGPLRDSLRTALRDAVGDPEAAHDAAALLERAGGRNAVEDYRARHLAQAQTALARADLPGRRSKAELASLIDYVVTHTR